MNVQNVKTMKIALFLVLGIFVSVTSVRAGDLPTAVSSPIAGITFDDQPLSLPVQRNFQMAMLTSSSELGRSCGRMEAYGWRMAQDEQQRVNQVFNSTVDRMRAQGYVVESQAPNSVSKDITLFTADRPDKHLIFMWSAGEIGLVMVLCETSAPASMHAGLTNLPPSNYQETGAALRNKTEPMQLTRTGKPAHNEFSPVGDWVGNYTCAQGTTGGTLQISHVKGGQFEGIFRFYPTPKNPYTPAGRYTVYGEYDADSQRILINPGKWLQRPKDFQNTIMIGSFDPTAKTFSGFFQGVMGCTSFEAKYSEDSSGIMDNKEFRKKASKTKAVKAKAKKAKSKKVEKKALPAQLLSPVELAPEPAISAPAQPSVMDQVPQGVKLP